MEIASLYNVSYAYHTKSNETLALQNLNIKIFDNEIVGIIGPSGCGKSTILSLFSGLICPENGKVYTQDKLNENFTGYMLQKDEHLPMRNVISNIMIGCEIKKEKDKSYAYELLKKYNLIDFAKSFPNELSGGMRQRVALIRTLVLKPSLLLLDEPFSALDYQTRLDLVEDVYFMIKQQKKSAVFVTHDIQEAISLCDKIYVLSNRPAHVIKELNLDEINNLSPLKRRETKQFHYYFDIIYECLKNTMEKQNE